MPARRVRLTEGRVEFHRGVECGRRTQHALGRCLVLGRSTTAHVRHAVARQHPQGAIGGTLGVLGLLQAVGQGRQRIGALLSLGHVGLQCLETVDSIGRTARTNGPRIAA